jgi:hypothetical protein
LIIIWARDATVNREINSYALNSKLNDFGILLPSLLCCLNLAQISAIPCSLECNYATARKDSLSKHIKNVHGKVGNLKCPLCDYVTDSKAILTTHMKEEHAVEPSKAEKAADTAGGVMHPCDFCDYATPRKYKLTLHIRDKINQIVKRFSFFLD